MPKQQEENIKKCKYIWCSHGHPDHLDSQSIKELKDNDTILLLPDHFGNRIYNDLIKDYHCIKLKSNEWFHISENVEICSFADWNQDASLIIKIQENNYILNMNDGNGLGWSNTIKKIMKRGQNRFLLKGLSWAAADMINLYDENNKFIKPFNENPKLGLLYSAALKNWNCNFAIPFSSFHKYIREDSAHMNQFLTPLEAHKENFSSHDGELLEPFIIWDFKKNDYVKIKPSKNKATIITPDSLGDNWTDELTDEDKIIIYEYFTRIFHLKKIFGSLTFRVGGSDFNIKLSNKNTSIIFEVPRSSLMTALKYEIFDDLLIGNFMKTTLINIKSLYPHFTPYVAKYADNGKSKSTNELDIYFNYYELNSADYWRDMFVAKSEGIFRRFITPDNKLWHTAKYLRTRFL